MTYTATTTAPHDPNQLQVEVSDGVAEIVFNRPEIHNAVNHGMLAQLVGLLHELDRRGDVKVVVLRGAGRSFCSGFELAQNSDAVSAIALDAGGDHQRISGYLDVIRALLDSPLILVGAVHGHCLGIGVLLAAACDLLVVEEDATFGMPAIPIGASFVSTMLGALIGVNRAKRMSLVAGGSIQGTTAYEWGLATDLVPTGTAAEVAADLAIQVSKMPKTVLRLEKLGLRRVLAAQGLGAALDDAADLDVIAHASADVHELKATIQRVGLKAAIAELRG